MDRSRPTRRDFLRIGGAGAGLMLIGQVGGQAFRMPAALAVPGGLLDATTVPKFQSALLIPPVMPRSGRIPRPGGPPIDEYVISVRQLDQQVLPDGMPMTTVWGYGPVKARHPRALLLHHAPSSPSRPATTDRSGSPGSTTSSTRRDTSCPTSCPSTRPSTGPTRPAGRMGGTPSRAGATRRRRTPARSRSSRTCTGRTASATRVTATRRRGSSPTPSTSWTASPASARGTTSSRRRRHPGSGSPGRRARATAQYPNTGRAATLWYHDHTLGMTRLNVYAGPAGFFLLRGGSAGDGAVVDARTGEPAVLPGPAPKEHDPFPSRKRYREIALAIQDRSFACGRLALLPLLPRLLRRHRGSLHPAHRHLPGVEPRVLREHHHGQRPHMASPRRRTAALPVPGAQRVPVPVPHPRLLRDPGRRGVVIGNEGGSSPVPSTSPPTTTTGSSSAWPSESTSSSTSRTSLRGTTSCATSDPTSRSAAGSPARTSRWPTHHPPARCCSSGSARRWTATPRHRRATSGCRHTSHCRPMSVTRPLALVEEMSMHFDDAPAEALLGTVTGRPRRRSRRRGAALGWHEPVTENPVVGDTEVWELYNTTGDAHPMHVHETTFEVVDRQDIVVDEEGTAVLVQPESERHPCEPWETGAKDTVIAYPASGDSDPSPLRQPGAVRVALPHRRARGQRDDAALPHRPTAAGPTGPAGLTGRGELTVRSSTGSRKDRARRAPVHPRCR